MDTSTAKAEGSAQSHPKFAVLQQMLAAGVHFGHRTSRWSPRMQQYIHGTKGTVHVVNLEKTLECLEAAETFVHNLVRDGKVILFVGTKPSTREVIEAEAKRCGMPYVVNRWLGGTLTNFTSLSSRLRHFADLESRKVKGDLAKYTKKEQASFDKEIAELESKFGGIKGLVRPPDALFIVDIVKEETAVKEATRVHTPTVAVVDTNADPTRITWPIPGNDDAVTSVALLTARIADAVLRGKAAQSVVAPVAPAPAHAPKPAAAPAAPAASASSRA